MMAGPFHNCVPIHDDKGCIYAFNPNKSFMVKRSKDEPDNKAAERLRQFNEARRSVPEQGNQSAREEQPPDDTQENDTDKDNQSDSKTTKKNETI
jgi:hypothetical protein